MSQDTYTAAEAADRLKITDRRVRQLAAELGVGSRVGERMLLFSEADIRAMEARYAQTPRRRPTPPKGFRYRDGVAQGGNGVDPDA